MRIPHGNRLAWRAARSTLWNGNAQVKAMRLYFPQTKEVILMINADEFEPQRTNVKPRDLQTLSIEELENYIDALKQEIARPAAMIAHKNAHKEGIDALFGKPKE